MPVCRPTRIAAAALMLLVAACDDDTAVTQNYYLRGQNVENLLISATSGGPLLVRILGNPFPAAAQNFEAAVIGRMNGVIQRRLTRFTADPAQAPHPDYRVVMVFGLPKGIDGHALCADDGRIPALEPPNGRATVRAAFCVDETLLSDVGGRLERAEAADSRGFGELISQVTLSLFPPPARD